MRIRDWLVGLGVLFLAISCTSEAADVNFTVEIPPTDQQLITRAEAELADIGAENVVLIGTVTGRDETVLVAEYVDSGDECVVVFEENGSNSACGNIEGFDDQWVVISGGSRDSTILLLATPPEATEVRVTTVDGLTYAAPTLGPYGYISFESLQGTGVLSVWGGDELLYEK